MIAVIADDITGAAEIAGIGFRFGMRAFLVTGSETGFPDCDLLVYATNTRSMAVMEAMDETRRVVRQLRGAGFQEIFKKTDSVLRGHIGPELKVMLEETGRKRALLIPENPSKGRVLRQGIYYVHGVPLDRTLFADDPEFPAFSAEITQRIPEIRAVLSSGSESDALVHSSGEVSDKSPDETPEEGVIFAADAETEADLDGYVARLDAETLPAGGADFFTAYLRAAGYGERELPPFEGLDDRDTIVVCGSTVHHSLEEYDYFKRNKIPLMRMPDAVFNLTNSPKGWYSTLTEVYELHHSIAVAVGHPTRRGIKFALRLKNILALAVSSLIDTRLPEELILEGGATAFSVLHLLQWDAFRIENEIAPGVVRMALIEGARDKSDEPGGIHVTLKPGSYPWGEGIFR